jgi:hypothetical protein
MKFKKNTRKRIDPGYKDPGTCDIGLTFDSRLCQLRHYKAIRLEEFHPCAYYPLVIAHIKKEKGEYIVKKKKVRKHDKSGICKHCGKKVNTIIGRRLCYKCYNNSDIKELYKPLPRGNGNANGSTKAQSHISDCDQEPKNHASSGVEKGLKEFYKTRLKELAELEWEAQNQDRLLNMKLFEVSVLKKFCCELEELLNVSQK